MCVFLSAAAAVVLYVFLHESGHALIAYLCGAKITEFSVLHAKVTYVGRLDTSEEMLFHVSGALFPLVLCYIYMLLYIRRSRSFLYHTFSFFACAAPLSALIAWIIMPVHYMRGTAPVNDDVTRFLFIFSRRDHTWKVIAAAAVLLCAGILMMRYRGIVKNFLDDMKGNDHE